MASLRRKANRWSTLINTVVNNIGRQYKTENTNALAVTTCVYRVVLPDIAPIEYTNYKTTTRVAFVKGGCVARSCGSSGGNIPPNQIWGKCGTGGLSNINNHLRSGSWPENDGTDCGGFAPNWRCFMGTLHPSRQLLKNNLSHWRNPGIYGFGATYWVP